MNSVARRSLDTQVLEAAEGMPAAVAVLSSGGVVAVPTETVYGLAADALDARACAKIFEAKERPLSDPLIVHVPSVDWVERLAFPSDIARRLAERFWPGPLTLVVPRRGEVPDIVTAGQATVALRMSAHPVFSELLSAFGRPVAAPSANRFGRISPTTAQHVVSELGGRIPIVLDGGACRHGIESTIVLAGEGEIRILRSGPVTAEQLGEFGPVGGSPDGVVAPGGLASHYSPRTPMVIGTEPVGENCGFLAWKCDGAGFVRVERLSADLVGAAAGLYAAMRRLDEAGVDLIVAEPLPEVGLGVALMDRLRRAAAK